MVRPAQTPLSPHPEWRVTIPSGLYYSHKSKSPPSPSYPSPSYAFPFDSFARSRLQRQQSPSKSGRTSDVPHPVHPDDQAKPFNRLGVGFLVEISVVLDLEQVCFLGPSTSTFHYYYLRRRPDICPLLRFWSPFGFPKFPEECPLTYLYPRRVLNIRHLPFIITATYIPCPPRDAHPIARRPSQNQSLILPPNLCRRSYQRGRNYPLRLEKNDSFQCGLRSDAF